MKIRITRKKIELNLFKVLFCMIIVAMCMYRINEQKMPIVLLDEFG